MSRAPLYKPIPGYPTFASDPDRACCGYPTDWWYPDRGPRALEAALYARAICRACPAVIAAACRGWAVEHREMGIWANTDEQQRGHIRRRWEQRARAEAAA